MSILLSCGYGGGRTFASLKALLSLPVGAHGDSAMPTFFMHLRRSYVLLYDEEPYERASLDQMREEAIWGARDLMAALIMRGERPDESLAYEITDEQGASLLTVKFDEAFGNNVQPPSYIESQ